MTVRCWHLERRHMLRFWLKRGFCAPVTQSARVFVLTCFRCASRLSITATLCWRFSLIWRSPYGRSVGNEGPQIIENIMRDFDTQRKVGCVVVKSRRIEWISWAASVTWQLYCLLFSESFIKGFVLFAFWLSTLTALFYFFVAIVCFYTRPTNFGPTKLQ